MTAYLVSVLTEGAIFGIMALGLNVIWGWSGDFDLAYYGYIAVGAYMTLVLTIGPAVAPAQYILGLTLPYPLAVVVAVITAMAVGLIVGLIALRHLRGIYFSIVTLGRRLRHVRLRRPVRPSLRRVQRPVRSLRPDG